MRLSDARNAAEDALVKAVLDCCKSKVEVDLNAYADHLNRRHKIPLEVGDIVIGALACGLDVALLLDENAECTGITVRPTVV